VGGPFDSAWLKWGQAVVHAHDLYAELNLLAAGNEHLCETRTEYDAKRHCLSLRITAVAQPPPKLSLMLGDVVHNYRSCLDHVAWTVVQRGRFWPVLTDDEKASVYFPLCATRDAFNASLVRTVSKKGKVQKRAKLPGVRRADGAIIRRYQPYKRGKRNLHLHTLHALASFSNEDKHRAIWPVFMVPIGGRVYVGEPRDCTITRPVEAIRAFPLEIGAEVHCVYVRKTGPNPDIEMEPHLTVEPAVTPEISLREWLTQTRSFIYQLLREFGSPPVDKLEALSVLRIVQIPR
jgi:hypothetical protein